MHILHAHSKGGMGIRDEIIAFCDGNGAPPFTVNLDEEYETDSSDGEDAVAAETTNSIIARKGLLDKLEIQRRIQSEVNFDLSHYEANFKALELQMKQQ